MKYEDEQVIYRIVDRMGYVTIRSFRYAVPIEFIGKLLMIRVSKERIRIFYDTQGQGLRRMYEADSPVLLPQKEPHHE